MIYPSQDQPTSKIPHNVSHTKYTTKEKIFLVRSTQCQTVVNAFLYETHKFYDTLYDFFCKFDVFLSLHYAIMRV